MQMRVFSSSSSSVRAPACRRACVARPSAAVRRVQPAAKARDVRMGFFKIGNKSGSDEAYGMSTSRADYSPDDVEHYFNYMGCLAVEGTYDRMEEMMRSGLDPVDVLLLLAAAENDDPKVEELLASGANAGVRDNQGRAPRELATKPSVLKMLEEAEAKLSAAKA